MAGISVIIPVYNVEKYIGRCIESVVNQTYEDLEIICVCGNSSDHSEDRCREWSQKDPRIICLRQNGGRLGTARNQAIIAATSDLIAFIDGDDWWDSTILEKLYQKHLETGADMVMCNRYNVEFDQDGYIACKYLRREISMSGKDTESVEDNPSLICNMEVSVNGKLFRKSLFTEHNIWQPDIFGEDRAIMHYLAAKCKKIGKVDEGLYYYHALREGNSVCDVRTYGTVAECMAYIRDLFVGDGIEEKFHFQLNWIFKSLAVLACNELDKASGGEEKRMAENAKGKIKLFMERYYPERIEAKYIWGSYNLRRIAEYVYPQAQDKRRHYAYSSVISTMSGKCDGKGINITGNTNQIHWLDADCNKRFLDEFCPGQKDILLIDFLEERFSVAKKGEGFVTYSPLFVDYAEGEGGMCLPKSENRIELEDRTALWERSCLEFIEKLKEKIPAERVYLVKSKLTEKYGTMTHKLWFPRIGKIKKVNEILEGYYAFFARHFVGIHVIELLDDQYFYTDEDFRYGCYPWHVNDNFYFRQAQRLEQRRNVPKSTWKGTEEEAGISSHK